MIGTWCTPELHKAVEQGFEILQIYEVWHFPEDQRKEGLFAEYVNKSLRNKTEATGWPKGCVTAEQKTAYVTEYYKRRVYSWIQTKLQKIQGVNKLQSLC